MPDVIGRLDDSLDGAYDAQFPSGRLNRGKCYIYRIIPFSGPDDSFLLIEYLTCDRLEKTVLFKNVECILGRRIDIPAGNDVAFLVYHGCNCRLNDTFTYHRFIQILHEDIHAHASHEITVSSVKR